MSEITVLEWRNNEAQANDVTYKIRQDENSGWWWCYVHVPSRIEGMRLTRPGNYHGLEFEAKEVAQEDAEKRSEIDRAREPGVRRIRA